MPNSKKTRRVGKLVVSSPYTFGPEAKTRVPCPACRKGMVLPSAAAKITEALKDEPEDVPVLITEVMDVLPSDPCANGHRPCLFGCNRCLECEYCKCTKPKR